MNGPIDVQISTDRTLTETELEHLDDTRLFILYMPDFLNMPDTDFTAVAMADPDVRALFN